MKRCYKTTTDNFKNLIEDNAFFVDKTLFIKEFMKKSSSRVQVITRPRKFGKSLNLSMLKYFLDIREKSGHLFKNLKVWHDKETMSHINKYPVIHLNFNGFSGGTYSSFIDFIKSRITKAYESHKYLLDKMDDRRAIRFKYVINGGELSEDYEIRLFNDSLHDLCRYLYNYYKKRSIVLIDDYDGPMYSDHVGGCYRLIDEFLQSFYSDAFEGNEYLDRALAIGLFRKKDKGMISGFDKAEICTALSKEYNQYFGFTEEEIVPALKEENLSLNTVRRWYKGYNFAGVTVYNPFSIANYLKERSASCYWVNIANEKIQMILSPLQQHTNIVNKDLNKLIFDEPVMSFVEELVSFDELSYYEESFWSFLFHAGYLTHERNKLKIPNYEIKQLFKRIIDNLLIEVSQENLILLLIQGKYKRFNQKLTNIFQKNLIYYNLKSESAFNAMMLQYAISLNSRDKNYKLKYREPFILLRIKRIEQL